MPRFGAVALLLALAGCATVAPPAEQPVALVLEESWSWQGRISVKAGEQALSGQLQWQHQPESDALMFTSPLGQGVARIVRDATGVVLQLPDEAPRQAPTVEALTLEALGYPLPVAGLAYWVQASPDPASAFELSTDERGRPARISQEGWTIEYLQYFAENPQRPRRISLSREDLEIRLVNDSWQPE